MNFIKCGVIVLISLSLANCTRSKPPHYYVLNPIACKPSANDSSYSRYAIGIDQIKIPEYIQKPQIPLHCNQNQVYLAENHHWAESLSKNMMRVVQANLTTLLPGAIVETSPWNSKFKPNYTVQIIISQSETNVEGQSLFRAEYLVYQQDNPIKVGMICYKHQLSQVTPHAVVMNINNNMTSLTRDIAHFFQNQRH